MVRSYLKKSGNSANKWKEFRDEKYKRDGGENIRCECYKLGFKKCRLYGVHLHHIVGRNENPKLYYNEKNLVWLSPEHHEMVHSMRNARV